MNDVRWFFIEKMPHFPLKRAKRVDLKIVFSKNLEFVEIITKKEFRAGRNNKERMQFSPPLLPLTTEEWLLRSAVENISQ